jgi:hypothetical protein
MAIVPGNQHAREKQASDERAKKEPSSRWQARDQGKQEKLMPGCSPS